MAALRDVASTGVTVRVDGDRLDLAAAAAPPFVLLEQLREHKGLIIAILAGEACRCCGHPIAWLRIGTGLTYIDGTSECMACGDSPTPANRILALEHWRQEYQ